SRAQDPRSSPAPFFFWWKGFCLRNCLPLLTRAMAIFPLPSFTSSRLFLSLFISGKRNKNLHELLNFVLPKPREERYFGCLNWRNRPSRFASFGKAIEWPFTTAV